MDRLGDSDGQGQGPIEDAGGVSTVAAVGGDERRMHVRAYNYWVSLLKGRPYPCIADLEPAELGDFGPNSVLLDFTGGLDNPGVAYLGRRLREECSAGEHIASIADVPSRSLLSRLTDHYLQIIANRAPIGFEAEFVGRRGFQTLYRGILMPFSSDGEAIDFIYGVINWKELVDPATQAALAREVGTALASAPPPASSALPVFADGPSAVGSTAAAAPRKAPAIPAPYDPASIEEAASPSPEADAELADWLVAARDGAELAAAADGRSRGALYGALGLAYDFALAAAERPGDYAELLEDAGIAAQARAPMTPIVKLVFGAGYDKTRLTEFAAALSHGMRQQLGRGTLARFVERHPGGLKGVVAAERALRRKPDATPRPDPVERLRTLTPIANLAVPIAGEGEFVLLVARRDGDSLAVLGGVDDPASVTRVVAKLAPDAVA